MNRRPTSFRAPCLARFAAAALLGLFLGSDLALAQGGDEREVTDPHAAPAGLWPAQMTVTWPMGTQYVPGWVPVIVRIQYSGKTAVEARCRISLRETGAGPGAEPSQVVYAPVSLSPGSKKQLCLYPLLGSQYYWADLGVELLGPDGRSLGTRFDQRFEWGGDGVTVPSLGRNPASSPVPTFVIRNQPGNWSQTQVRAHPWDPADAPDRWIGYSRASLVVLNDCPLDTFRPESERALLDWVARGGAVLISPGKDPAWLSGRLIKALWPDGAVAEERSPDDFVTVEILGMRITSETTTSANGTITIKGSISISSEGSSSHAFDPSTLPSRIPFARVEGEPLIALADGKTPFLCRRPYGFGWVYFIGVDVSAPPFASWPGREAMWTEIVTLARNQPGRNDTFAARSPYDLSQNIRGRVDFDADSFLALLSRRLTRLPPVLLVIVGILAYLAVVGPVNFFWLRKRGRHQWLCLTIPAVALVFVIANLLLGYASRGLSTVGQRLVVTEVPDHAGPAIETQYYALCSAASARYRFSADSAAIPWRVPAGGEGPWGLVARGTWRQGGAYALEDTPFQTWDLGYFRSDAVRPAFGRVQLIPAGEAFLVKNESAHPLKAGVVFLGNLTWAVEALAPGQSARTGAMLSRGEGPSRHDPAFEFMGLSPKGVEEGVLRYIVGDGQA
ncbi:MAG: hypothetical protein HYY93_09060 [Planctomycetes bacterium]|nr:hypothetical protein [Planctomycetota bacterium]